MMTTTTPGVPATGRQAPLAPIPREVWRVAWVIVFGAFMTSVDGSLVTVGLDTISRDTHASLAATQWVTSGYLIALAAALPACAWLGRRLDPGRLWLYSLAGFTCASGLCAAAPGLPALIVLRLVQGATGGLLVPAGQTVLGRVAGPTRMGRVMNAVGVAVVLAPALGPTLGGLLIQSLSWRWLFLVNVPVGAAALVLGARHVPRGRPGPAEPLDLTGLLLVGGGLPLVTYGIAAASERATLAGPAVLATLLPGLGALGLFAWRFPRRPDPLLDLRLFTSRVYTAASVAVFWTGAALFGSMVVLPLSFELYRHDGVVTTGLLMLAYGGGAALSMRLGGRLTDRIGGGTTALAGLAITVAATVPFTVLGAGANLAVIESLHFLRGVGISLAGIPTMSAAYAAVRKERLPDATALTNILQRVGGAVSSAVSVVLLTSHATGDRALHAAFWWLTASAAAALVPVGYLARAQRAAAAATAALPEPRRPRPASRPPHAAEDPQEVP
jgi:EmrB/QacA subfamily drug resistance transporter